jgi:drug/metabolite transporter (DMT)-like permease
MTAGRRSLLDMIAFVALWAAVEALATHLRRPYSPYQVVFTRYVVHLALMLVVWGWRAPAALVRTRRPVYQLVRSLLMLGMPASFIIARQRGVDAHTLLSIFWLAPLLVLGFAAVHLRERAPLRLWIAAAVACGGALEVVGPGPLPPAPLLIFPLGMAVTFSLYVAMTRSLRSETMRANLFYTALGVAAALAPLMARVWVTPSLHDLAVMVGVGVLGFGALLALDRSAAAAPVSLAAPVMGLQLVFTLGFAGLQLPSIPAAAGLLAIGAAAVYVWAREPAILVKEPT